MQTPLDLAHSAMQSAPDDEGAALAFYERLSDAELFMMLEEEVSDDAARPLIFETEDGPFALVFDREERLAEFVETPTPYVALSGRRITKLLVGQGIGLGVNLSSPSAMLLPPDAVEWLFVTHGAQSIVTEAMPEQYFAPKGLPESLIGAIDTKLANMSGVVAAAYLVGVSYVGGLRGHMLALLDVPEAAREGVAEAIAEALQFSGIEAGQLDVAFLELDDPHVPHLVNNGLGFEIPALILPTTLKSLAPGMDPDKPPKLR